MGGSSPDAVAMAKARKLVLAAPCQRVWVLNATGTPDLGVGAVNQQAQRARATASP